MTDHCCHNMRHFTRTPEEAAKSGFWAAIGKEPPRHPPLVDYRERGRIYSFQSVALYYCPWCGAKLPEFSN